ncbi:MAG: hypothetical protein H5T61_12765 [Thermoflexales bacterium]|nr:hypothetical protein [Thermoflexales bacterium]
MALLALGRSRRRMGWVVPVGAVLLVVAVVCAGAALMSGGAEAAVQGSAGAEVRGSESAEEMVTRVITYTYDPLYRLTGATYSTGESFAYAYDAVGNRTVYTETTPANGTRTTQYAYDAANRLLVSITAGQPITYTWDARGNLIGDGTFTYAYNSAGRLVRASSVTATLAYTYTADGLRVGQAVDGAETTFAWDWAAPVPEVLVAGSTRYLVGHETLGWAEGGAWRYILPDALGSVRQAADGAGAVVQAREWMPYGEEVGGAQAGLGYTGEWQDADVGLVYLRARWYDGDVGRFTQVDPWRGNIQQPQTVVGAYVYVGNNPVNFADSTGMWRWWLTGSIYHLLIEQYMRVCQLIQPSNWSTLYQALHFAVLICSIRHLVMCMK